MPLLGGVRNSCVHVFVVPPRRKEVMACDIGMHNPLMQQNILGAAGQNFYIINAKWWGYFSSQNSAGQASSFALFYSSFLLRKFLNWCR